MTCLLKNSEPACARVLSTPLLLFLTRAPDGSCILTNSADNVLRVYNLPPEIYSYNWDLLPEMVSTQTAHTRSSPNVCATSEMLSAYGKCLICALQAEKLELHENAFLLGLSALTH